VEPVPAPLTGGGVAALVESLAGRLLARGWRLATAESCTGGLLAAACTDLAGSSRWFERGWVTYSNEAKHSDLGVPGATLARHGAVSEPVVLAMADGARARSGAALAVSVSGIAGPDGGTPGKPVGLVWFAVACEGLPTRAVQRQFPGDRAAVRAASVRAALEALLAAVPAPSPAAPPDAGADR
jgi:nicotinamide-nucleotide amidase